MTNQGMEFSKMKLASKETMAAEQVRMDTLMKAFKIAVKNGYTYPAFDVSKVTKLTTTFSSETGEPTGSIYFVDKKDTYLYSLGDLWLLFGDSHRFAKALFGEQFHMTNSEYGEWMDEWEWQLQQMVIAPDPIAYLGANI